MFGFLHQFHQYFLIKLETGIFPVIEQCHTIALTIFQLIITRPCMNVPARLSCSFLAQCEDEFRSFENILRSQFIIRSIRIDGRNDAQRADVVHLKGETEVAGPAYRAEHHLALVLLSRLVEAQFEERFSLHSGTCAELCVYNLFARAQLGCLGLTFLSPVAVIVSEIIL